MSSTKEEVSDAVKFNIGGTLYEVSRSLLKQHPNTMISRMTSETWQQQQQQKQGHDEALFIERDGPRFRYILDYMWDGKIGYREEDEEEISPSLVYWMN